VREEATFAERQRRCAAEGEIERLDAKIGQLNIERGF
jgi:hypothetical protein